MQRKPWLFFPDGPRGSSCGTFGTGRKAGRSIRNCPLRPGNLKLRRSTRTTEKGYRDSSSLKHEKLKKEPDEQAHRKFVHNLCEQQPARWLDQGTGHGELNLNASFQTRATFMCPLGCDTGGQLSYSAMGPNNQRFFAKVVTAGESQRAPHRIRGGPLRSLGMCRVG